MEKRLIDDTSISVVQRSNVRFVSSPSVLLIYLVQSYISLNTIYPFTNGKWNSILTSSEIMLIAYIQNFYSWKLTSKLFLFYFSSAVIHQRHQSCRLHRRAGQLFARHKRSSFSGDTLGRVRLYHIKVEKLLWFPATKYCSTQIL